jgi:zinc resistance-associated protein
MTQEQHDKYIALFKNFVSKATPLRDQLQAKFLELKAIQGLSGTTRADVNKVIDDITALRGKLRAERQAYVAALEKEGLPVFGGRFHKGGQRGMGGGCPGMMRGDCMGMMGGGYPGMMRGNCMGMMDWDSSDVADDDVAPAGK